MDSVIPLRIVAIDDAPEVLAFLESVLGCAGHELRSFRSALKAIPAVAQDPPDVILLDLDMPGMDGFTACAELKSRADLKDVPIIVVTGSDLATEQLRALELGAVDFITKPLVPAIALARIATHGRLRRAQLAERELLHRTLTGTVNALIEIVGLAAPAVDARGRSVRSVLRHVAQRLGLPASWRLELAGRLFLIGCVCLPQDLVERATADGELSEEETALFERHPRLGRRILEGIPRLEFVGQLIAEQLRPSDPGETPDEHLQCVRLLQLAMRFDRLRLRGVPLHDVVAALAAEPRGAGPAAIAALRDYPGERAATALRIVRSGDLREGMVLDEDIRDGQGTLIARRGIELTQVLIDRLVSLAGSRGAHGPYRVMLAGSRPEPA